MKNFISTSVIPSMVVLSVIFGVYNIVLYNIAKIKADPQNAEYITIHQRDEELLCLADNIYYETGGENMESKVSVAQVTLNRVSTGKYGKGVCGVVYAPSQFSWTISKPKALRARNTKAYEESKEVAKRVLLEGYRLSSINGALFYHADYVSPSWANSKKRLAKIGKHIFYS